jgi:outer membrane protein assembly factor BamB
MGGISATVGTVTSSAIAVVTPAHAQGPVDVVVRNPDGQSARLASGYTFVSAAQPPQISSVSPSSGPTGGGTSVTIAGSRFQPGVAVVVGGTAAQVVSVTTSSIAIATPAHAAGPADVVVTNPDGLMARLAGGYTYVGQSGGGGELLWQVVMDGSYSMVRPALGPDGTVYAIDVSGTLHAVSPSGTLLWKVVGAGGKGLAVGPDGTVYVGSESFVRAYRPDGTRKWVFQQTPFAYLFVGLGVGPDGNLYCLATNGLGIFSLTPQGTLRWASSELYNTPIVSYGEIAFGPGPAGNQLYFYANHHLRALTLDGRDVFLLYPGGMQPVVSPLDGTMHLSKAAYFPSGTQFWFNFDIIGGSNVVVGRDGTHYQSAYIYPNELYALDPVGALKWTGVGGDYQTVSGVDPANTRVLVVGNDGVDFTGLISAYDVATGDRVWRLRLPAFQGFNQTAELRPGFSFDGAVAYYVTTPCAANHACLTAVAVK